LNMTLMPCCLDLIDFRLSDICRIYRVYRYTELRIVWNKSEVKCSIMNIRFPLCNPAFRYIFYFVIHYSLPRNVQVKVSVFVVGLEKMNKLTIWVSSPVTLDISLFFIQPLFEKWNTSRSRNKLYHIASNPSPLKSGSTSICFYFSFFQKLVEILLLCKKECNQ